MAIRAAGVGYRNLAAQNVQVSAGPAPVLGPTMAATSGPVPVLMPVSSLTSIQMRAAMDQPTVDEYAEVMLAANGWGPFPPAEAFFDGSIYWMWRGNHRRAALLQAAKQMGASFDLLAPVIVRPGTKRDAELEGLSDNAEHGLRRSIEDKRKAVDWALSDAELSQWSNAKIAAKCRVSAPFVGERREIMQRKASATGSADAATKTRKYIDKHGQERVMNISGIAASNQARATATSNSTTQPTSHDSHNAKGGADKGDGVPPITGNVSGEPAAVTTGTGAGPVTAFGVVDATALQAQFLAVIDSLAAYVQITGDSAGVEVLRRGLLAALERLPTI